MRFHCGECSCSRHGWKQEVNAVASRRPRVSIITPTYNRAGFIAEAVESVLAQTMPDWELLIVDDGSTDNTLEALVSYGKDSRIQYMYQTNQGQGAARNAALAKANGEFIGFLDSDDIWMPDKLERQIACFEDHPDVHIVHGDETIMDEGGREVSRINMSRYSGRITPQLLADNSVSITTALVRRECFVTLGHFDTRYEVADDYELWLRFSARYRFHYDPRLVAGYRVMADQISSDKRRRFAANERIIGDFLASNGRCLSRSERRWGLARFYVRKARYFASLGERRTAWGAISRALGSAPTSPLTWRGLYRVVIPKRPG